jgi:hypothetical protein
MGRVAVGQVFLQEGCFTLSISFHGYSIFIHHKHYVILAMDSVTELYNLKKFKYPTTSLECNCYTKLFSK